MMSGLFFPRNYGGTTEKPGETTDTKKGNILIKRRRWRNNRGTTEKHGERREILRNIKKHGETPRNMENKEKETTGETLGRRRNKTD